jgi:hypothetical protein
VYIEGSLCEGCGGVEGFKVEYVTNLGNGLEMRSEYTLSEVENEIVADFCGMFYLGNDDDGFEDEAEIEKENG